MLRDGSKHGGGGVGVIRLQRRLNGQEAPPLHRVEFVRHRPLAIGLFSPDIHQIKALFVILIAKVEARQAAGVDHGRVLGKDLVAVDVPQGDVVKGGVGHVAQQQDMLLTDGHLFLRADLGAGDPYMGGQDGGQLGVELGDIELNGAGQCLLQSFPELLKVKVLGIFPAEESAAPEPGERGHLYGAAGGVDFIDIGAVGNVDVLHRKRVENLGAGGAADGVGQVVVADEEEDGDIAGREAIDAAGKFSLLGLGGLAGLVGVPAEDYQVHPVLYGEINYLIKGGEEI